MVVLEDVSWKSGIKWAIATTVGGLIIAVPLAMLVVAVTKPTATLPEVRVGSRSLEVSAPIRGRYEIAIKR